MKSNRRDLAGVLEQSAQSFNNICKTAVTRNQIAEKWTSKIKLSTEFPTRILWKLSAAKILRQLLYLVSHKPLQRLLDLGCHDSSWWLVICKHGDNWVSVRVCLDSWQLTARWHAANIPWSKCVSAVSTGLITDIDQTPHITPGHKSLLCSWPWPRTTCQSHTDNSEERITLNTAALVLNIVHGCLEATQ